MIEYRREIDGLRALAVVPVIFFHAGFEAFSGGFTGVDVFFVISGYLITSILLSELGAGDFSIVRFYERRARRILPALCLVMAVSLPVAWLWLLPTDLENFGQSLAAVAVFASNILFWRESNYFDPAAELKPLLHTWSLAVEEQFYLVFPLFLMVAWRLDRKRLIGLLTLGLIASLAVAHWGALRKPVPAFFLLPTRAWELALGAMVAFCLAGGRELRLAPAANQILSLGGIGLIVYGVLAFDDATPFPGLPALVPTLGTALVILFAGPQTLAGRLLGAGPLVGVGLISYSAYLWHQPLFAFARHQNPEGPSAPFLVLLSVAAVGLAYLSWRFVEMPFRNRRRFTRNAIFAMAFAASAFFVAAGLMLDASDGAPSRYSEDERALLARADYKVAMRAFELRRCFIDYDQEVDTLVANECVSAGSGRPRMVLFGDSEAAHLAWGAHAVFGSMGYEVMQWTATSCRPADFPRQPERCHRFYRRFVDSVLGRLRRDDILVIAGNWGPTYKRMGTETFSRTIESAFSALRRTQARVVVFDNAPDFQMHPINYIIKHGRGGDRPMYMRSIDYSAVTPVLRSLAERHRFFHFDPFGVLCEADAPRKCLVFDGADPTFTDANHLSTAGSARVMAALRETIGAAR